MKILLKRRLLKGKKFVIMEDMADDIANLVPRVSRVISTNDNATKYLTTPPLCSNLSRRRPDPTRVSLLSLWGAGRERPWERGCDIARRLRVLKSTKSVESAWFSNVKLKYKQHRDPRVQEIRGWSDLGNLE